MYREYKLRSTPDGRDWSPGIRQTPEGHENSNGIQVRFDYSRILLVVIFRPICTQPLLKGRQLL